MRSLASSLGVEAMSLYNHVANKEQLLNGMVELVLSAVYSPKEQGPWKRELRKRGLSFREVLVQHPWVAKLIESRHTGPVQLRAHDAVQGCLRAAGFSVQLAHRAFLTFDSYLYGFAFQEATWPHERAELPQVIDRMLPQISAADYPHIVELMHFMAQATKRAKAKSSRAYQAEFEFGLDLVLDGLERVLDAAGERRAKPTQRRRP